MLLANYYECMKCYVVHCVDQLILTVVVHSTNQGEFNLWFKLQIYAEHFARNV